MQPHHTHTSGQRENPDQPDLYTLVRAGFVAQGKTLAAWCRENGVTRQVAERCLKGTRNGRRSIELRDRIAKAAGIEPMLRKEAA